MEKNPALISYYEEELEDQLTNLKRITFVSGPAGCGKSTLIPWLIANKYQDKENKRP